MALIHNPYWLHIDYIYTTLHYSPTAHFPPTLHYTTFLYSPTTVDFEYIDYTRVWLRAFRLHYTLNRLHYSPTTLFPTTLDFDYTLNRPIDFCPGLP